MTFIEQQLEISKRLSAEASLGRGFNEPSLTLIKSGASLIFLDTIKEQAQICSAVVANIRVCHSSWARLISPQVRLNINLCF
jgi:hypothetical protein